MTTIATTPSKYGLKILSWGHNEDTINEDGYVFYIGIWEDLKSGDLLTGTTYLCMCGNCGPVFSDWGKENLWKYDRAEVSREISSLTTDETHDYWESFINNLPRPGNKLVCRIIS